MPDPVVQTDPSEPCTGIEARRDKVIQKWRMEGTAPGVGNQTFFDLARDFANTGTADGELLSVLHAETAYGNSPGDRRRQARDVIRKIRRRPAA